MQLRRYSPRYTVDDLQTIFRSEYAIDDLEDRYFRYMDSEYVIVCPEPEYTEFLSLVAKGNAIFTQAYDYYRERLAENLPEFAFLEPLFQDAFPIGDYLVGRYDIIREEGTGLYKFLETNANTPGMITERIHIGSLLCPEGFRDPGADLEQHIRSVFAKHSGQTVGILLPYSFEDEDYLTGLDYQKIVGEVVGTENVVLADIFESHMVAWEYFSMKGRRVDVVLSFFPIEFFLSDVDFCEEFFRAANPGNLKIYNPLESIVLQDKLVFAVVHENIERYSPEDQAFIRRHIPFTTRAFQEDDSTYLAKWRFGRYGREIYQDRFHSSLRDPKDFVFQRKIIPEKVDAQGNFLVYGAYTDYRDGLSLIARKQRHLTTADEDSRVTLVYVPE